jgi:hypothetical protein
MEKQSLFSEIITLIIASIILAISYIYPILDSLEEFLLIFGGFILIIGINIIIKKIVAYRLEANVTTRFWSIYRFGFAEKRHLKKPLPMIWLSPFLSFFSRGAIAWLPILEFEITPRTERIAKRHELYRFAQMTEWHIALIVFAGVISNILLYIILNFFGMKQFATLSLFYAIWSIIPLSNLDGAKLFFGSRKLWIVSGIITLLAFVWQTASF